MALNVQREVRFAAKAGTLRTAQFQGTEHIVVPVVAMVEGVVWAMNAPAPELVLFEEISRAPKGWNGRPIVGGHPLINGQPVSANDPSVLETEILGHLFHANATDNRLKCEAWINPKLADRPGTIGERLLQRLAAIREGKEDDIIEVSVGAFMALEQSQGSYNGVPYSGIWRDLVPDHLAFLAEGDTGACSAEMGCGAPRNAKQHLDRIHIVTSKGISVARDLTHLQVCASLKAEEEGEKMADDKKKEEAEKPKKSFKQRMASVISALMGEEDMSDRALRQALDAQLRATVPGFLDIAEVVPGRNTVVAITMPGNEMLLVQYKYAVDENGVASLKGEGTPVQEVRSFEPIAAAGNDEKKPEDQPTVAAKPCGCAKHGEGEMTKAQRINALIASGKFKETERAALEATPEPILNEIPLEDPKPVVVEEKKTVVEEKKTETPSVPNTVDEFLSNAPEGLKSEVAELQATASARRTAAIGQLAVLRTNGRHDYSDQEISSKPTKELERLIKLAGDKVSFAGAAGATVTVEQKTEVEKYTAPPPVDFIAAMKNKRTKAS